MMQCLEAMDELLNGDCSAQIVAANNGFIFVSSILPTLPQSDRCVPGGVREQLEQAFENLRDLLNASDSDLEHLVSIQILVPDKESLAIVNEVSRRKLLGHRPARNVIPCGSSHPTALVEINAVAVVSPERVSMKWHEQIAQPRLLSA